MMDSFPMDGNLYEVNDVWDNDDFESISMGDSFTGDPDWAVFLDHGPPTVVLNDRMITDALHSPRTIISSSDHSYSLVANECEMNPDSPHDEDPQGGLDDFDKDLESECFPAIPMSTASSHNGVYIKQEPMSASSSPQPHRKSQSLLKPPTIILATRPNRSNVLPKVNMKMETSAGSPGFSLPPTPPSSTSSDSEGSLSPEHVLQPVSPSSSGRQRQQTSSSRSSSQASSNHSSLISSQPKGATGTLVLTDEEKRTLLAEGYPIPSRLPLSKAEEKSLKKIRRKIKNKISAQESRRKKKEYMDALEKKVEILNTENTDYKKRVDSLENSNKSLLSQLHKLQALVGGVTGKPSRNVTTQTSSLMSKRCHTKGSRS
uniref:BZIP domain-containing protein n=1 Tax=Strigamia maritima TaxID=126957 RepID=T1JLK8_STRMM